VTGRNRERPGQGGTDLHATLAAVGRRLPAAVLVLVVLGALAAAARPQWESSALGRSLLAWLHLDVEGCIATWFSSGVLLLDALLLAHAGCARRAAGDRAARTWLVLAAGCAFLSMDETVGMHERLGNAVARGLPGVGLGTFAWVLPGSIAVAAGALAFGGFLRRQPEPLRGRLIRATACYFGGALGLEAAGAWLHAAGGKEWWAYEVAVLAEEGLEMLGAVLLCRALLADAGTRAPAPPHPAGAPRPDGPARTTPRLPALAHRDGP